MLDAEAFNALAGPATERGREVARIVHAARHARGELVVPTTVLAELYQPGHLAKVDACLSRRTDAPRCRDTDRVLARLVGGVLASAGAGSEHLAGAHVVAAAVEAGRSIVVTGDGDDLTRLAASYPTVTVVALP